MPCLRTCGARGRRKFKSRHKVEVPNTVAQVSSQCARYGILRGAGRSLLFMTRMSVAHIRLDLTTRSGLKKAYVHFDACYRSLERLFESFLCARNFEHAEAVVFAWSLMCEDYRLLAKLMEKGVSSRSVCHILCALTCLRLLAARGTAPGWPHVLHLCLALCHDMCRPQPLLPRPPPRCKNKHTAHAAPG